MAWLGTAELASVSQKPVALASLVQDIPPDVFRNEIHKVKNAQINHLVVTLLMSHFCKRSYGSRC